MQTLLRYKAGQINWEDLKHLVLTWQWVPRARQAPEWGDAFLDQPGSFADVETAYSQGLLTYDEYQRLYELRNQSARSTGPDS